MGEPTRHIERGIEAVIDSAYVADNGHVWVHHSDAVKAIRQVDKLADGHHRAEVYADKSDNPMDKIALKL